MRVRTWLCAKDLIKGAKPDVSTQARAMHELWRSRYSWRARNVVSWGPPRTLHVHL